MLHLLSRYGHHQNKKCCCLADIWFMSVQCLLLLIKAHIFLSRLLLSRTYHSCMFLFQYILKHWKYKMYKLESFWEIISCPWVVVYHKVLKNSFMIPRRSLLLSWFADYPGFLHCGKRLRNVLVKVNIIFIQPKGWIASKRKFWLITCTFQNCSHFWSQCSF